MQIRHIAFWAVVVSILTVGLAEGRGLFRRCHTCQTGTGANAPGRLETKPAAAEKLTTPPAAEKLPAPITLDIASSGLEDEVQNRIKNWAAKGVIPGASTEAAAAPKTIAILIEINGQKFEGTLTLKGTGGGKDPVITIPEIPVPGDLAKTLQAAFDSDTVQKPAVKVKIRDNLSIAYSKLAASVSGSGPLKLTMNTIEGVRLLKNSELNNAAGPNNLPKTQEVINQHLSKFLPKGDNTALTPQLRATLAGEFDKVSKALSVVK